MEVEVAGKMELVNGEENGEQEEKISRPTTPSMPIFDIIPKNEDEWWRPSHPPETYKWEEVRRQREKGGYPWTLLDNEEEDEPDLIDPKEYLDDNVYEPVNPPPLYESGSTAPLGKDNVETGSLDGRRFGFHIPPEIEIVNSVGLDGLDLPDPHDHGFDGDREWGHSDDEQVVPSKKHFTAGFRGQDAKAGGDNDSHRSSIRPLTNKSITFDPTTKEGMEEQVEGEGDGKELGAAFALRQQSRSRSRSRSRSPNPRGADGEKKKSTTAFEILRSKAAGAADQMKQRFGKFSLPTRPKFSSSEGAKLQRKKKKKGASASAALDAEADAEALEDQQVPQEEGEGQDQGQDEAMDTQEGGFDHLFPPSEQEAVTPTSSKEAQAEEALFKKEREKEAKAEEAKKAAEEKEVKAEEARKLAEEKKRKQKEADDIKKAKAEEKKKEAEEQKRIKAEEKAKAKEEADKKKAEEKAAKLKAQEEEKKRKLEEQLVKAREAEEAERLKNEALLIQREKEAAEKAGKVEFEAEQPSQVIMEEEEEEHIEEHGEDEIHEAQEVPTPTGTGSRRKKIKKTYVQLPKMPDLPTLTFPKMPELDFKRKVIKRSKTPPARPTPPKQKFKGQKGSQSQPDETENQLAAQYAEEIEARKLAMEEEDDSGEVVRQIRFPDTPIFVTQPSTDASVIDEGSQKEWKSFPSRTIGEEPEVEYVPEQQEQRQMTSMAGPSKQEDKQQPIPGTKERLDKFGQQLKGFGAKASKKSKAVGASMKVLGKDLQKLGAKTSEKFQATIEEIKAKQDAAKARSQEMKKAKEAEDIERERDSSALGMDDGHYESATEPRRKFRFRRRDESQEEDSAKQTPSQQRHEMAEKQFSQDADGEEHKGQDNEEEKRSRSQLLGRAERDWESPLDLAHSRDMSEEPFSGNASSRNESPPGSSMASSTFAHKDRGGGKQGVLEEIDSDEFFLREKGISEGEDEEEINRFLVEELRQAFRLQENSLAGFDLPDAPQRPERAPRKPARKSDDDERIPSFYQTFPPERPRRKAPGYVSDYLKEHDEDMEEDQSSTREERGSFVEDLEDFEDEGIRKVKEELEKIDHDANDGEEVRKQFEDDGRYEPIEEVGMGQEPVKPMRRKKEKSTPLYYNTVAGNEWMRELEDQVHPHFNEQEAPSLPPPRQGQMIPQEDENDVSFVDAEDGGHEDSKTSPQEQDHDQSQSQSVTLGGNDEDADGEEDNLEYVDEAGYAVVHKSQGHETPSTVPRRKKKSGGGSKNGSLKRGQGAPVGSGTGDAAFFSLPRHTPRTFHITPPSRPQRTYSTLRPRRPPRHRSNHSLGRTSKQQDPSRPSTAIGIMQNRPLPPPPAPARSPVPLNDLDHTSLERSVGARHYANFVTDDNSSRGPREVEEVMVARNISLLGRGDRGGGGSGAIDVNIGIQTDPVQEYANEAAVVASLEDITRRVQQLNSDFRNTTASSERLALGGGPRASSTGRDGEPPFNFPRRLHLDELEVDVLRVNDLSAHSITVEQLQAPQLEVNSLTCIGSLSVSSIHTQTLNSDQINCNRLSSDTVDLPTIVPPSFYNLASRPPPSSEDASKTEEKPEQGRLHGDKYEGDELENDLLCPYSPFEDEDEQDVLKANLNLSFERPSEEALSPSEDFFNSARPLEFCLTPEQSMDNDDSWGRGDDTQKLHEKLETESSPEFAHCSELTQASAEKSSELSSLTPEPEEEISTSQGKLNIMISNVQNISEALKKQEDNTSTPPIPTSAGTAFKIAVLENERRNDKAEEDLCLQEQVPEAGVVSGSLRLEYRRSPEVPSDFQVLHDINVETEERPRTPRGPQSFGSIPRQTPGSFAQQEQKKSLERSSTSGSSTSRGTSVTTQRSRTESMENTPTHLSSADTPTASPEREVSVSSATLVQGQQQQGGIGRVISRIVMRGLQAIIDYIDIATTDDPNKAEEQRAHMQVLLCVLLVFIAGIILSSNSAVNFSPPKWEFLMPPPHL